MNQTLEPITELLTGIYGSPKTAKSSIMLTVPKPMVVFDLDQSFSRAQARLVALEPNLKILIIRPHEKPSMDSWKTYLDTYDVIVRQYNIPLRMPGTLLAGYIDLWEGLIIPEMICATEHPRILSICLDTGTLWWTMDHQSQLERAQQNSKVERSSLLPIEYARPNTEARALLGNIRNKGKNLVSVHHVGPKHGPGYEEKRSRNKVELVYKEDMLLGETWAGFTHLAAIVDVIARSRLENYCNTCQAWFEPTLINSFQHPLQGVGVHQVNTTLVPTLTIEYCGYALEATNGHLPNPSFDILLGYINGMRALQMANIANGK